MAKRKQGRMGETCWYCLGIGVVVLGFVVRANPLLVVMAAALTTGLAAAWTPEADLQTMYDAALATLAAFGKAFNDNRYVSVVWLVLAAIGLLERAGLQERARMAIANREARRQSGRCSGCISSFAKARRRSGSPRSAGMRRWCARWWRQWRKARRRQSTARCRTASAFLIRSHAAAADNIALFFGEDIFIAIASILLIKGFLEQNGIFVEPLELSVWAIPTAIAALAHPLACGCGCWIGGSSERSPRAERGRAQ